MLEDDQLGSLDWLKEAKGSTIKEILVLDFVPRETGARSPLLVWIALSNDRGAGIKCAANGSALEISYEYPTEYEMGEYGKTELRKHRLKFTEQTRNRLDEALVLFDEFQPVALRMSLSGGEEITLANVGDELTFVDGHHPMFDEIKSEWQAI